MPLCTYGRFQTIESFLVLDPSNVQAQRDLLLSYNNIGGALLALGRTDEARNAYRAALAIAEKYAAAQPGEVQLQFDVALSLFQLADIGDDPKPRLERGLALLRQLDAAGRLNAGQKSWISLFEQALAALPK
jgi:tetratricopeptide (TPR) repeat protein